MIPNCPLLPLPGDETISVDSTEGMTANDVVSIVLDDSSVHWAAIERVVSASILAVPPLPSNGAAAINNTVTVYTIKPPRPLRIVHARRKESPDGEDIEVDIEGQKEYRDQPLKTGTGTPVFITYKPTLTEGRLEIWQPPNGIDMFLGLTVERPFEIISAAADNPDIPEEWYDPLVYLLAERLEPEYRLLDANRLQLLTAKAQEMWKWVNDFDDDTGSMYLMPDFYGYENQGT